MQKCQGCFKQIDTEDAREDYAYVSLDSNIKNFSIRGYYFCRPCFDRNFVTSKFSNLLTAFCLGGSSLELMETCEECSDPITSNDEEYVYVSVYSGKSECARAIFHKECFKLILKRERASFSMSSQGSSFIDNFLTLECL